MSTFIQEFAKTLLNRYNNDLSNIVVMFPSLRARVFFNDAISTIVDRPLWQPSWSTIDELMERGSGLIRGERIRLISELFKVYKKHHPSEKFDQFYFWGEMLISDFDMIDKYLIDADALLRNIEDIKEIEADVSYLTKEQEQRILSFWKSIGPEMSLTEQKRRFLKVWRSLPAIYREYREQLFSLGIGYSGMIYRATAERIKRGEVLEIGNKRYVIAGFNALSKSEKVLFSYLAKSPQGAEFYWDYDNYYIENKEHEAGLFMRDNISQYPESEPLSHDSFETVNKSTSATGCVSNIVQIKHVADIISTIPKDELDKRTAIVLTDENMLIPLLHSLPESVKSVNVTMGYPIKTTLAYSFLERLVSLRAHIRGGDDAIQFYHVDVTGLLSHPYITDTCKQEAEEIAAKIVSNKMIYVDSRLFSGIAILEKIFSCNTTSWRELSTHLVDVMSQLLKSIDDITQQEYLRIITDEILKTTRSIENCGAEILNDFTVEIFTSLLRRHIQTLTIPYEGEPIEGVQIMGILETRNIDFKNVIILSMTDATFPGDRTSQSSFIPYGLRFGYEMPTYKEHEAMYAYYFYRLIQRAERVEMLYCSRADQKSTGEKSRYIYQLEYESKYDVVKRSIGVDLGVSDPQPIVVEKSDEIMESLNLYLKPKSGYTLSPTSLFKYVECPLKFYFSSIAKLHTPDELDDNIDSLTFGEILHDSMQELYEKLKGIVTPHPEIKQRQNRKAVEAAVDNAIRKHLRYGENVDIEKSASGDTLLVRDILIKYILGGIMRYDLTREGFAIEDLETDVEYRYPISDGRTVGMSGRVDRLDSLSSGMLQVVDYKSSKSSHLVYNGPYALFNGESGDRISNVFQILLYAMMLHRTRKVDVVPSLYYASQMLSEKYSPLITDNSQKQEVERYTEIKEVFEAELERILVELFDDKVPFSQVEDENMCKYCDFKKICRR